MSKTQITFVIAGNHQQFKYYYPKEDKNIRYVNSVRDLAGIHGYKIDRVGTWYERPDIDQLEQQLKMDELSRGSR